MKNKITATIFLFAIIASLIPSMPVSAQEDLIYVEIQPEGANMKDNFIVAESAGSNYGSIGAITVGEQAGTSWKARSLLEFDLSGLPRDPTMVSATLVLTVATDLSDNARTMYVYALNTDWSETTSNWNNRFGSTPWTEAGAFGVGDDVLTDPIGSVELTSDLEPGDQVEITITNFGPVVDMIKQNYFGFLLKMDVEEDDQYDFYSSDEVTEEYRPMLILEYYPGDEDVVDPGWFCADGSYATLLPFADCIPEEIQTSAESPFDYGAGFTSGGGYGIGKGLTAAILDCEPYPRCINDYPIYYRVTYDFVWVTTAPPSFANPIFWLIIGQVPGDTTIDLGEVQCGSGTNGRCIGTFEGVLSPAQLPTNYADEHFTLGAFFSVNTGVTLVTGTALTFNVYFSLKPFDQDCFDTYYVPLPETFQIDPLIEMPLGESGTPPDYQIYPTEIGKTYMVRVQDGPWNDGIENRTDAAVSLDGETWMAWDDFSAQAVCVSLDPLLAWNPDYQIIFFTATTENFYIRVNDVDDEFADNTNSVEAPFSYVIGEALLLSEESCDSSFSFDPEGDLFAEATINSTAEGTLANEEEDMQSGEWYAIEVESGTWNEPAGEDRTDMEFTFSEAWADLSEGSDFVWCVGSSLIYIQAPAESISLRVNDQDSNFSNNSGSLEINIYHVSYTYVPDGCAEEFETDDIVASGVAKGEQVNGVPFANNLSTIGLSLSYAVLPGAWYMLETRDGPWWLRESFSSVAGEYQPGNDYYDVQIKTEAPSSSSEWVMPDEWALATCVVEIDAIGHIRIYFQVPDNNAGDLNQGGAEYFIRVAGAGFLGMGEIGWDLYQAINVPISGEGENPWETCYLQYIQSSSVPLNEQAWIPVKEEAGTSIIQYGATGGGASVLIPDKDYWLQTSNGPWFDGVGGVEPGEGESSSNAGALYSAQLSSDGGTTWFNISEHPGVFCSEVDPLGSYERAFFHVNVGEVWKIRVADTETELFTDNTGTLAYTLHAVNPHGFPITTDEITDYNFEVCAPLLVRPYIPGMTSSTIDAPTIPSSWDVEDWVTYFGNWFSALGNYFGERVDNIGTFLSGLGRYIGDWFTYMNRSFVSYFAWCPRHVNILLTAINRLQDKEPLATLMEIQDTSDTVWAEVESYDWGVAGEGGGEGDGQEYVSIFSFGEGGGEGDNTNVVNYIFEKFFPLSGPGVNIWSGDGDIVVFGSAELPTYYYTCNDVFGEFLPARLRQGVCFVSGHWRATGAWWWVQLSIDISTIFLLVTMIKSSAQSLIYMMTGVRPWTKDGALRGLDRLADAMERQNSNAESSQSSSSLISRSTRAERGSGSGPRTG